MWEITFHFQVVSIITLWVCERRWDQSQLLASYWAWKESETSFTRFNIHSENRCIINLDWDEKRRKRRKKTRWHRMCVRRTCRTIFTRWAPAVLRRKKKNIFFLHFVESLNLNWARSKRKDFVLPSIKLIIIAIHIFFSTFSLPVSASASETTQKWKRLASVGFSC